MLTPVDLSMYGLTLAQVVFTQPTEKLLSDQIHINSPGSEIFLVSASPVTNRCLENGVQLKPKGGNLRQGNFSEDCKPWVT